MKSQFLSNYKVRLTEVGYIIIGLTLLLSVIGFLFQSNLIYLITAGLLALILTDLIFSFFSFKDLKIYRFCPSYASRDKEFTIKIKVENHSFSKFLLRIRDGSFVKDVPGEKLPLIFILKKGEAIILDYIKKIKARGIYYLDHATIESAFPFGIWRIEKLYPLKSKIIIYPEFYEAPQFIISYRGLRTEFANTTSNRPGLGGDFLKIREFQPGDSLKNIHWRATARANRLMVKQLEKFTLSNLSIVLDNSSGLLLGLGEESNFEYAVKTAATIAERALSKRYHVKFISYDQEIDRIQSLKIYGRMTPLLDMLAKINPTEKIKIEDLIDESISEIERESVAVFVILTLTTKTTERILSLSERGVECVLVLFNPSSFAAVVDQNIASFYSVFSGLVSREAFYLTGRGIRVYMINQGDSISLALSRPYMFINA